MIPAVIPSTDLKTRLRSVKDTTADSLAIITENGRGRFIFGSRAAIDHEAEMAAWEEANAERIIMAVERGRDEIARGDFIDGTDAMIAYSEQLRMTHVTETVFCTTTEFKAHLRHYKELAKTRFVYITEHGRDPYVLVSIEVYEAHRAEHIRRAKWLVHAESACARGARGHDDGPDATPRVAIEYLGQPWDAHVSRSFDDDVKKRGLTEEEFGLVRHALTRLSADPHVGRPIEVGPDAWLAEGSSAYRLPTGAYDIIYAIDQTGDVRVYGLIEALNPVG